MIELLQYTDTFQDEMLQRIADFYQFHASLFDAPMESPEGSYQDSLETLETWRRPSHELYLIQYQNETAGFLHLSRRGENVAWIEDIYVDTAFRNRGIATQAIRLAQDRLRADPSITAVCFDVVPRNTAALRLYHKLGYDSLSLLTVRKEFYENKRDKTQNLLGLEFKY